MAKNNHKNKNANGENLQSIKQSAAQPTEVDALVDNAITKDDGDAAKAEEVQTDSNNIEAVDSTAYDKKIKKLEKKNKRREKAKAEKTTFMHKMKTLGVLLVLGIFTGSGLGVWYFNVNLRSKEYSDDPNDYITKVEEVLSERFNITSASQRENWMEHIGNTTPDDLTPVENFLLASYNATLADTFLFTGNGSSKAMGVTQTVYSLRRFDGQTYTFESISKGLLSIANLDVYKKGSKTVDLYKGSNISQRNAKWNYSETITTDAYQDMTGSLPSGITTYIISEKTVLKTEVSTDEGLGRYVYTFTLDPYYAALNYYKEMKRTGDLEGNPEFTSIVFTATIDSNWNLITTAVEESYYAIKLGLKNSCKGNIVIDYQFNCDVTMPSLKGK